VKLKNAIVFAKDLPRMRAFYEGGLGLRVIDEQEGWVELDAGGAAVALHAIPAGVAAKIAIKDPPEVRERTPIKLSFEVDDIERAVEALRKTGARMFAVKREAGSLSCDGVDPEGNVFRIAGPAV